jgi:hypothetical protein
MPWDLPPPNLHADMKPLVENCLRTFNQGNPLNVVAVKFDGSKGVIDSNFIPRRGNVVAGRPVARQSPSASTAASGVGFLIGYEQAIAENEKRAAESEQSAQSYADSVRAKEIAAILKAIASVHAACMATLEQKIANATLSAAQQGGGYGNKPKVKRVRIHGFSKR